MKDTTLELIKSSACKLFAHKGYGGTSIRDISQDAGVNVSAINYHFGSKEGLFLELMNEIGREKGKTPISMLLPPKSVEEMRIRLEMFFTSIIEVSVSQPNEIKLFISHLEKYAEMAPEQFEETFIEMNKALINFTQAAQKAKILEKKHSPEILCQIVFGSLFDMIGKMEAKKRIFGFDLQDEKFRKKYIETLIDALVRRS